MGILNLILILTGLVSTGLALWSAIRLSSAQKRLKSAKHRSVRLSKARDIIIAKFKQSRQANAFLRESETLANGVFAATHTGLLIIDTDTMQVTDANPAAAQILDSEINNLIDTNAGAYFVTESGSEFTLEDLHCDNDGKISHILNLEGQKIPVIRSSTSLWGTTNNLVVASFLDVTTRVATEKKLLESHDQLEQMNQQLSDQKDQIVRSEKLASIGQLAAGVAHEINNPIGYITSNIGTIEEYAQAMKQILELYDSYDSMEENDPERLITMEKIQKIKTDEDLEFILGDLENVLSESALGASRVSEIVKNLKSFAREDVNSRGTYRINDGIDSMIKMVWNELKYNCTIKKEFGEIPAFQCNAGQVNQVIMNMLVNASHAMPDEGGIITLTTSVADDKVILKIADNGSGIEESAQTRIFDPFFTTKAVGDGTGLGLSVSHGIIADHDGTIELESELGKGTTFIISLPLVACEEGELIG